RDLCVELGLSHAAQSIVWRSEPDGPCRSAVEALEIYQDSSGGQNWRSANHVNRYGESPCSFRGYRTRADGREDRGLRASPVVSVQGAQGTVTVAMPYFWQQFPKALEADRTTLRVGLFPQQHGDLFEL